MTTGKFALRNTRAAKVNGEQVMWIRQRYADMWTYPRIREALKAQFGVVMSIQQITRIAKGESFAQLPVVPHDREMTAAIGLHRLVEPTSESQASLARVNQMLSAEESTHAREPTGIEQILSERDTMTHEEAFARVGGRPTLEEIERREHEVLGTPQGAGLTRLMEMSERTVNKAAQLLDELEGVQSAQDQSSGE